MTRSKATSWGVFLIVCGWAIASCDGSPLMDNIASRTYGGTGERITPHGFDPGFNKKIVYINKHIGDPAHPNGIKDRWICAASPCQPQPPGSGYYNLVQDRGGDADISSSGYPGVFASGVNTGKPGIISFNWVHEKGMVVSDLQLSNLHLDWKAEAGPYAGIQMEYPNPGFPTGGVTPGDIVPLSHLRYIHLKMRSAACKPPREVEPWSSGRILYYIRFWNNNVERANGAKGMEIALGLQRFVSNPQRKWVDGGISAPGRARWECAHMNLFAHPTCGTTAVDVDAASWGVSKVEDFAFWTSNSCNVQFHPNQEFLDYVIDVPRLMVRMIDEGFASVEYLKGANYIGGILNGIEFFGPAMVRSQVASHTIYKAESPQDYEIVLNRMRVALERYDPGFLSATKDFVWRDTVPINGQCPHDAAVGQFCDSATQYGKACSTGSELLVCTNIGLRSGWFRIGSAAPCRAESSLGNRCSSLGATCLNGQTIIACSDRPYAGGDWAPDTHKYMTSAPSPSAPPPTAPSGGGGGAPSAGGGDNLDQLVKRLSRDARCNFDANHYLNVNPDVRNAGITDPTQVLNHYIRYGIAEGRGGGCPPSRDQLPRFLGGREEEMPFVQVDEFDQH